MICIFVVLANAICLLEGGSGKRGFLLQLQLYGYYLSASHHTTSHHSTPTQTTPHITKRFPFIRNICTHKSSDMAFHPFRQLLTYLKERRRRRGRH